LYFGLSSNCSLQLLGNWDLPEKFQVHEFFLSAEKVQQMLHEIELHFSLTGNMICCSLLSFSLTAVPLARSIGCNLAGNDSLQPASISNDANNKILANDFRVLDVESLLVGAKFLGRGGFGEVFAVQLDGIEVAVKRLLLGAEEEEVMAKVSWAYVKFDQIDAMRQEIAVLSRLKHPHVVQLLGYSLAPLAIVMERAQLGGLDKLLVTLKGRIPLSCEIEIIHEISAGMLYLHSNNVLHRDLSKSVCWASTTFLMLLESPNVLIDHGLKIKIADFGLSRIRQATYMRTNATGTMTHMAPECFEGIFSRKTDVYAFAMTSWEILTQDWPQKNFPNYAALMRAVDRGARPELNTIHSDALRRILVQSWHAEPDQRPSFAELQIELVALKLANPSSRAEWRALEDLLSPH
jgi:serine/threonine protein kinase